MNGKIYKSIPIPKHHADRPKCHPAAEHNGCIIYAANQHSFAENDVYQNLRELPANVASIVLAADIVKPFLEPFIEAEYLGR